MHTHSIHNIHTNLLHAHNVYHVYTTCHIYYVCANTHLTHVYHTHHTHAHTAHNTTHSHTSVHYTRAVVSIKPKLGPRVIAFHHRPCQHCNNQFRLCLITAFVDSRFPLHPWYPVISVHGNIAKSLCTQLVPQFLWRVGLIRSDFVENDTVPRRGIKDKLPVFWKSVQFLLFCVSNVAHGHSMFPAVKLPSLGFCPQLWMVACPLCSWNPVTSTME